MAKKKEIELQYIIRDDKLQQRASMSRETVNQYAERMTEGDEFPPIVVFVDPKDTTEKYYLADGYLRTRAAEHIGFKTFSAEIHESASGKGFHEAFVYSLAANAKHGSPRTNADKRRAVEHALAYPAFRKYSDNKIAEVCLVSQPFVSELRKSLEAAGDIDPETERETRSGKTMTVQTKEKEEETDGKDLMPEVTIDPYGYEIPEEMRPAFNAHAKVLDDAIKSLGTIKRSVAKIAKSDDDSASYFDAKIAAFTKMLNEASKYIQKEMKADGVCPYCKAGDDECPACGGIGIVNASTYKSAPEDFKRTDKTADSSYWESLAAKNASADASEEAADETPAKKKTGRKTKKTADVYDMAAKDLVPAYVDSEEEDLPF